MKNQNAFPHYGESDGVGGVIEPGMTLLDYFAAKAMQATRSNPILLEPVADLAKDNNKDIYEILAQMSYEIADAMIKEREKYIK